MKYVWIVLVTLLLAIVIFQVYMAWSTSKVEHHQYSVVSKEDNFEIRKYEPAVFASVQQNSKMFESQNQSFRDLAGYIFGGNSENKSIAMTAPVHMTEENNQSKMTFVLPSEYNISELPEPNNRSVNIYSDNGYYAAVICYGGINNKNKFNSHKNRLIKILNDKDLQKEGPFVYLGYNPPFQWFARKNEVMVKIDLPS